MKTTNSKKLKAVKTTRMVTESMEKAVLAKRLAEVAREHLHAVEAEHKRARKAFKLAKKVAKKARKKAKKKRPN
jgi:hypothetical protein